MERVTAGQPPDHLESAVVVEVNRAHRRSPSRQSAIAGLLPASLLVRLILPELKPGK